MSLVRRWLLGRRHRAQADFIGDKVDYLFRQVRHRSGREYTVEEVAHAIGKPAACVSKLRRGHLATPGAEVLCALSDFSGVDRMYWFRPVTYIDEHDPSYPDSERRLREERTGARAAAALGVDALMTHEQASCDAGLVP